MTQLAAAATADTPEGVEVPATISGLTRYVIGKWGPWGFILIGLCIVGYLYVGQVQQTIKIQADEITDQRTQIDSMRTLIQTMDRAMRAAGK